jgi:hypothetical protein
MSTFDYSGLAATAQRLIARFGAPAFVRKASPPYVGDNPWSPTVGAPIDTPVKAVLTNYSDVERQGTLIEQNDRKAIFAAQGLSVVPNEGDQIVIGARAFTIISLVTAEPGAVALVYIAQVRL